MPLFFFLPPFFSTKQRQRSAKYSVHTLPSFNPSRLSLLNLPGSVYGPSATSYGA
jgi:hypothetical protein